MICESKNVNDLQEIACFLPFLSEDMVDQLAIKAAEEDDSHNLDILKLFVSEDVISDIARKWVAEGKSIAGLASFICEDDLCELAGDWYQKSGLAGLADILPFIDEDQLEQIAEQEYAVSGLSNFSRIAPFLNEDYLNALAQKAIRKDGIKAISPIAPFLDSKVLSEFVKEEYLK